MLLVGAYNYALLVLVDFDIYQVRILKLEKTVLILILFVIVMHFFYFVEIKRIAWDL